ncbi:lytic murein transglycosylase B [Vreelandella populi]|uniref:Lytic murein transglycosylase B n=1 Tax=Vreelandella populi TaxID=2498858 RepID=A0A433LH01_9GAMM|nr:lytic murein transglycosylase B [Halomonas populi]RUR40782.1 lytic murein transglycosylase B [Halomonas populi]RUR49289.1 lytic murein transglycosylase B [Halomonas populi]RUR55778.1 lytic murein transglycosylase B [Halomonas populi]
MNRVRNKAGGYLIAALLVCSAPAVQAEEEHSSIDLQENERVQQLIDELATQGVPEKWLQDAFAEATYSQGVLDAMEGAAERRLRWFEYRNIFLNQQRIAEGAAFMETYADTLARAEEVYGVPGSVITAIIGVETYYGRYKGQHRVLDSLATLAFYHPSRGDFFRGELAAFLKIAFEQEVEPAALYGSYAGAMGYPQFIPTSYQAYAVDFDDDGFRDLWENPVDAIGSVANYFAEHDWQRDGAIYHEATGPTELPEALTFNQTSAPSITVADVKAAGIEPKQPLADELPVVPLALEVDEERTLYRLGEKNFYVITRYNHSHLYAMAVTELAEAIQSQVEEQG